MNWIWDLPTARRHPESNGLPTNSRGAASIITLNDGIPFTPTFGIGIDVLGAKSTDPIDFPDRITGPGCKTAVNPGNVLDYINTSCFAIPTAPSACLLSRQNCDPSKRTYPQKCFELGSGTAGRHRVMDSGRDFSTWISRCLRTIAFRAFRKPSMRSFAWKCLTFSIVPDSASASSLRYRRSRYIHFSTGPRSQRELYYLARVLPHGRSSSV